jgi:hypothetical protein
VSDRVMLPCGHCSGTGRKEARKLSETLAAVHPTHWQSTQALALVVGSGETNMANRLRELRDLELVESRGTHPREWRLKP